MVHHLTLWLDRQDFAALPCIAGVAGALLSVITAVHGGRPILALGAGMCAGAKVCLNAQAPSSGECGLVRMFNGLR